MVKNLPAMQETQVRSLGWEDSLEKEWQHTPVFLPGESHGQRSLVGTDYGLQRVGHNWRSNTFTSSGSREAFNQELINSHSWGKTLLSALSCELQGFPTWSVGRGTVWVLATALTHPCGALPQVFHCFLRCWSALCWRLRGLLTSLEFRFYLRYPPVLWPENSRL